MSNRNIKYLVVHTPACNPNWTHEQVRDFALERFKGVHAYHLTIDQRATVMRHAPNHVRTFGVSAYVTKDGKHAITNSNSVHIGMIGGIDAKGRGIDNYTIEMKDKLFEIIKWYLGHYPNIIILGHNQIAKKLCPCFNVPLFLQERGVAEKNILKADDFKIILFYKLKA